MSGASVCGHDETLFTLSSPSLHPLFILSSSSLHPLFILSSPSLRPLFTLSSPSLHPLFTLSSSSLPVRTLLFVPLVIDHGFKFKIVRNLPSYQEHIRPIHTCIYLYNIYIYLSYKYQIL